MSVAIAVIPQQFLGETISQQTSCSSRSFLKIFLPPLPSCSLSLRHRSCDVDVLVGTDIQTTKTGSASCISMLVHPHVTYITSMHVTMTQRKRCYQLERGALGGIPG